MAQREPRGGGQRRHRPDDREGGTVQHEGHPGESNRHGGAGPPRTGLPGGHRDEGPGDADADARLQPVDAAQPRPHGAPPAGGRHARHVGAAQQQQRLDRADVEERHEGEEQRDEQSDREALEHGRRGQAIRDVAERGREPRRNRRQRRPGQADAEQASRQGEQGHLQHVGGQHLAGRRAEALQNRDAADLLAHEHARDAPDADPAQHDDDEPDETQEVLGALEAVADPVLRGAEGPRRHEPVPERLADVPHQRLGGPGGQLQQDLICRPAAERQQPCRTQVREIHEHARAETEPADTAPRLLLDDPTDRERVAADDDASRPPGARAGPAGRAPPARLRRAAGLA